MRIFLILSLCSSCYCFVPLPILKLKASIAPQAIPIMYCIASANEHLVHRLYMHRALSSTPIYKWIRSNANEWQQTKMDGDGHIEHHADTYDCDMSLKTNDPLWMNSTTARVLNADPWRGSAIHWDNILTIFVLFMLTSCPILSIVGMSLVESTMTVVATVLYFCCAFNSLHPYIHGLQDVPHTHGPPTIPLLRNLIKPLAKNHVVHHQTGGRIYYNLIFPGFDYIAGTVSKKP